MKKYKLLKDLPTFKAGDEFFLDSDGDLFCPNAHVIAYYHDTIDKFPNILKDWFEEIPEQLKTVWDLEEGEECWQIIITPFGAAADRVFWHITLEEKRSLGLIFLTKEECLKELARRKAKQILLRDTKGFKPKVGEICWEVFYDPNIQKIDKRGTSKINGDLRFNRISDADTSIKVHEKEWKVYLGVEDGSD